MSGEYKGPEVQERAEKQKEAITLRIKPEMSFFCSLLPMDFSGINNAFGSFPKAIESSG